MTALMANSFW